MNVDTGTFDMYLWQSCPNIAAGVVSYGYSDLALGANSARIYPVLEVDDVASRTGSYISSGIALVNINPPASAAGFYIEARGIV